MVKKIIADIKKEKKIIAVLENDKLSEFYIEKFDNQRIVGNIYTGKVENVFPGIQAAFIDIGLNKNAFLYLGDMHIKEGQDIIVQVIKESFGEKGPKVTTNITLPGKYVVLLPETDYLGVSKKITEEAERNKLRNIVKPLKPENMGIIIRTASESNILIDYESDIKFLLLLWDAIQKKAESTHKPECIYTDEGLVYRSVRDMLKSDINKFVINEKNEYENVFKLVKGTAPQFLDKITFYTEKYDILDFYNITSQLKRSMSRKVWLDCGGYIVIDRTEALTVIDVNTGKNTGSKNFEQTILKTNLESVEEIVRQLRIRDIGGIIIIDMIDMSEESDKKIVLEHLKEELKKDKTHTSVMGITSLGLIEMTRKKVGKSLDSVISSICTNCSGTGRVIDNI